MLAKNHSEPITSENTEKRFVRMEMLISSSTPPSHSKTSDKLESARQQVIFELINTEEQYVEDLRLIVDVSGRFSSLNFCKIFMSPMRGFLSKQEVASIFANIEAILDFHEELLVQLQELKKDKYNSILGIAKPLLDKVDMLKFYVSRHQVVE